MSPEPVKSISIPPAAVSYLNPPAIDLKEILRYAGCGEDFDSPALKSCLDEVLEGLRYSVCWTMVPVAVSGSTVDLGFTSMVSSYAAELLASSSRALVFAATVGLHPDRVSAKYSRISPSRCLFSQAIGTERVEALCNDFCISMAENLAGDERLLDRFSPGYGDIPLELQRDIFKVLEVPRNIGVTLTESLMMMPTKSVTAIAGISHGEANDPKPCSLHGCASCSKTDCQFRR